MNIDLYDKIILSDEALGKILDWGDEHVDLLSSAPCALTEGIIECNSVKKHYYYFNMTATERVIKLISLNNTLIPRVVYEIKFSKDGIQLSKSKLFKDFENTHFQSADNLVHLGVTIVWSIMAYIAYFESDKKFVIRSKQKNHKRSKQTAKNQSKSVVKFNNVIYLYVPNHIETPTDRPFERKIDSWGVRGHWRTYKKSGMKIWIDPYIKGSGIKNIKVYEF